MGFDFFSHNGEVLPSQQAVAPLNRLEFTYGFGVYESIRVSGGKIYFLDDHCQRLLESARLIGLDHNYSAESVKKSVLDLVDRNKAQACNVKILLGGGRTAEDATLDILCLNPLFVDRSLYKKGVVCITFKYERDYPAAKTLNMLSSYLAFRQAKSACAYDALLINRDSCLTEGTRTNFFGLQGRTIVSPPSAAILPGVTRMHLLKVARQNGFEVVEQAMPLKSIDQFDGLFLTSTSSKVLPIRQVDETRLGSIPPALSELMQGFDDYLKDINS